MIDMNPTDVHMVIILGSHLCMFLPMMDMNPTDVHDGDHPGRNICDVPPNDDMPTDVLMVIIWEVIWMHLPMMD